MPAYDFRCKQCGEKFEVVTSINGRKDVRCPKCGSSDLSQLLTGVQFARTGSPGSPTSSCGGSSGSGFSFG
ncbi:MAG: zinc ribbon domain-containing protein [Clostridia bacterium]|nr:zinc ribbon domain-containing protein [Clostridia bacterium]